MQTITVNRRSSSIILPVLAAMLLLICSACSRKINFSTSSVVPAAQGAIKIKKDHNSNHAIEVSVKNLAESKRLQPPKETYVVWIDTEYNGVQNIGQLRSSGGLFSNTLKASLKAVTAFKPVRVFITAENSNDTRYPGNQTVLTTAYFNR